MERSEDTEHRVKVVRITDRMKRMRKGECDVAVDPTQCKDDSGLSGAAPSRNTTSHSLLPAPAARFLH